MNWMDTNDSPIVSWSERARIDHARWSTPAGVPVEIMVDLANRLGADAWFSLPHLADADFQAQFATLVRDRLDPSRRAWIEWSNEVWNGVFDQALYAQGEGLSLGLSANAFQAQLFYQSRRSRELLTVWETVFGGTSRLVRVMAAQAANDWVSEQLLAFESAGAQTDALAIAPYFGGYLGSPVEQARVSTLDLDQLFAELETVALPEAQGWLAGQLAVAQMHGVELVAYEGGQHIVGFNGVENDATLNALFDAVNRDPRMGSLYTAYFDGWRTAGGRLFCHFVNAGGWSKYGRWGALEYGTQPRAAAPKFDALMTWIDDNPRWW